VGVGARARALSLSLFRSPFGPRPRPPSLPPSLPLTQVSFKAVEDNVTKIGRLEGVGEVESFISVVSLDVAKADRPDSFGNWRSTTHAGRGRTVFVMPLPMPPRPFPFICLHAHSTHVNPKP
jgi:hypothetical protein